jgi:hypothetical protein
MVSIRVISVAATALLLVSCPAARSFAQLEDQPNVRSADELLALWESQEGRVESARLVLKIKQIDTPVESASSDKPGPASSEPASNTSEHEVAVLFSGHDGWCRIDTAPQIPEERTEELGSRAKTTSFDGTDDGSRSLRRAIGPASLTMGTIFKSNGRNDDLGDLTFSPIFLALRPTTASFIGSFTLDKYERQIDGRQAELTAATEQARRRIRIDLDNENIVQLVTGRDLSQPFGVVNIRAMSNFDGILLPSEWSSTFYAEGKVIQFCDVQLRKFELNPPCQQSDFRIEFPVGALVMDRRNERSRTNPRPEVADFAVVQDDGVETISQQAFQAQLMNKTAESLPNSKSGWRSWLVIVNVVGVVVLILALVRRKRLQRAE